MTNNSITNSITAMKQSLLNDLKQAKEGVIIDISKLPEQLMVLHQHVAETEIAEKADLVAKFEELLELLDQIAKEIHSKYEDLNRQIKVLDQEPEP
ncbi:hypothetical protein GUA87_16025 [Sneathiella sp. P13V-1]|uniref:hypothetical protein n=1 Tax=Sneathiella sp. P13V-1 TaxID=2697366 RepID=UPI00187B5BC8|nr:hypothetical protein [Sneathiella sp. P13V-1]MBE7638366.1 hypothetical protein [Sneathiella sp. P13V-1]